MRTWLAVALLLAAGAGAALAQASATAVDIYLFWRIGCPRCEREIEFLDRLAARTPSVRVHKLEVSRERSNAALMVRVAERLGVEAGSVPMTVIGDRVWVGYLDDAGTGADIEAHVAACLVGDCPDSVASLAAPVRQATGLPETVHVPVLGNVRVASLSLPVLTVLLAAADGFNPCALWVLVFLLGLLAGMKDRTRMWALGGAFVATSAVVYLLVLAAWLNLLLFVGAIVWVRLAVGLVALGGGGYYVRDFFMQQAPVCEVTGPGRQRVFARLKALALERSFLVALGGIVLLAFAVNVVEFLCSAGIPAVFTQVLALAGLPAWHYGAYLVLYVLVFMADDLVVLFVALRTLEVIGLTTTYARWSSLAGGIVLVGVGALLIARPEWLTFGG